MNVGPFRVYFGAWNANGHSDGVRTECKSLQLEIGNLTGLGMSSREGST